MNYHNKQVTQFSFIACSYIFLVTNMSRYKDGDQNSGTKEKT